MKKHPLRALLVDDESLARARLKRLLTNQPEIEIIGEAADGLAALARIAELSPDIVFLDIEMPELDGIGVARSLGLSGPSIVFVTAYDAYALQAFETNAIDYVVKPIVEERLRKTIEKLILRKPSEGVGHERLASFRKGTKFAVRTGARFVVCDPRKVVAVLAKDHYAAILMDGRELLADDSLDVFEARFDPELFIRVHRSAIVNLDFIHELEREGDRKYTAVLSDPNRTRVPISRERLDEVKARLGLDQ